MEPSRYFRGVLNNAEGQKRSANMGRFCVHLELLSMWNSVNTFPWEAQLDRAPNFIT